MKKYLVIRPSPHNDVVAKRHDVYFGSAHDTFEEAQQVAATRAGIQNEQHYVVEILGFETPIYDPAVGWRPWVS